MSRLALAGSLALLFVAAGTALAQDGDKPVSKEDYDKLKKRVEELEGKVQGVKKDTDEVKKDVEATRTDSEQQASEFEKAIRDVREKTESALPGSTKFVITGYGFSGFSYTRPTRNATEKSTSVFSAGFNPIFLWRLNDRILFEAEPEFTLENSRTKVGLEYADASITINDYLIFRGGVFLSPVSHFAENLHPAWINKLPDKPLHANEDEGIVPFSNLGLELRGAAPIGPMKITYAAFIANGPTLVTDDPKDAGRLSFDNFDGFNAPTVGGRISVLPLPDLELGVAGFYGRFGKRGTAFANADGYLLEVDLNYMLDVDALYGTFDLHVEWVLSHLGRTTFDPDGSLGFGPTRFANVRQGGYVQLAYRPSKASNTIVKDLELIVRYDWLDLPGRAPTHGDTQRYTAGVDYWLTSSVVFKVAYELTETRSVQDRPGEAHGVLAQVAVGF